MFRVLTLTTFFALAGSTATLALPPQPPPPSLPGSEQEHAACHGDVVKFCRSLLPADPKAQPDVFAIANCLQNNRSKISAACNAVLTGHAR